MQPALIIVSNRLPVSVKKEKGKLEFYPSTGGLATGLASYANDKKNKWIGWPGIASDDLSEKERQQIAEGLRAHNCYPVFLTKKQLEEFYNGYSNSVLWPVFHDSDISRKTREAGDRLWKAYRRVNALFAEVVLALSNTGDTIWVHDYQLLVLPALLRMERPYDRIGFFLHIPFPAVEQFTKLGAGEALLAGMLGADLVGLHIESYVQNFLGAVQHYDSGITQHKKVILQDRVVRVTDFPMGIDYAKYEKARKSRAVMREYAKLRLQYAGMKMILTVDRLDPAKGLVERARAYQTLLRENPRLHGKVVLVMLVVPSRTEVAEYKKLKRELEKVVREVNEEFGLLPWIPIEYMFTSLPFEQVTALYRRADVAFIAPLRDGMNLVAKEYLASKTYQRGVLILSRTAGAAEELKGAIMVDPTKPATLVQGLTRALEMRPADFKRRVRRMQKHISASNVHVWASNFTHTLSREARLSGMRTSALSPAKSAVMIEHFKSSRNRLLLLDYDGVLEPFHRHPENAEPSDNLKSLLERIGQKAHLVIVSGRGKDNLEEWLGDLPAELIAEHGMFVKPRGSNDWQTTPNSALTGWQDVVLPVLEKYAGKTPGAEVEAKDASLVWHYRKASPYYAQKYLVTLKRVLQPLGKKYGIEVRQGNKILELRPSDINKGAAAAGIVQDILPDFVLAIGDDYTDEDMFVRLPADSYTVKVGRGRTAARYRLKNSDEVLALVRQLAQA